MSPAVATLAAELHRDAVAAARRWQWSDPDEAESDAGELLCVLLAEWERRGIEVPARAWVWRRLRWRLIDSYRARARTPVPVDPHPDQLVSGDFAEATCDRIVATETHRSPAVGWQTSIVRWRQSGGVCWVSSWRPDVTVWRP